MEEPAHAETFKDGRRCTKEADILVHDASKNVGAPTSKCRHRRSLDWYTSYMSLMSKSVEIEPSSFEEAVKQLVWVDAMVEEYDSIIRNSVCEVIP